MHPRPPEMAGHKASPDIAGNRRHHQQCFVLGLRTVGCAAAGVPPGNCDWEVGVTLCGVTQNIPASLLGSLMSST
jgi:hypothetical protein